MTDVDLRLLVPRDIRLIVDESTTVLIPGEVSVADAMRIEQIRGDIWAAARERENADSRDAEAAARALIADGYQRGADVIHELAQRRNKDAAPLDLTVTQIDTVLQMLVAPVERETLMAQAYAVAMGLEVPELDPLDGGSSTRSSGSGEPGDSEGRTGETSRGARGSRSGTTRGGKR